MKLMSVQILNTRSFWRAERSGVSYFLLKADQEKLTIQWWKPRPTWLYMPILAKDFLFRYKCFCLSLERVLSSPVQQGFMTLIEYIFNLDFHLCRDWRDLPKCCCMVHVGTGDIIGEIFMTDLTGILQLFNIRLHWLGGLKNHNRPTKGVEVILNNRQRQRWITNLIVSHYSMVLGWPQPSQID